MACTLDECDEMISAARKSDRILMVGQTLRFWPEYGMIRDLVKSGALGKPLSATAKRLAVRRVGEYYLHLSGARRGRRPANPRYGCIELVLRNTKTVYSRGQRSPESEAGTWH